MQRGKWLWIVLVLLAAAASLFLISRSARRVPFSEMNEAQCRTWLESRGVVYPSNADKVDWDGFALQSARLLEENPNYPSIYSYTVASDFFEEIRTAIVRAAES